MKEKNVDFSILFPPNMNFDYFDGFEKLPFSNYDASCNLVAAWWLAESSLISYEHPGFIHIAMRLIGANNYKFFSGVITQAFVFTIQNKCIVSFRGTEVKHINGIADLMSDVTFKMVDFYQKGLVHKGFKLAFDETLSEQVGLWDYVHKIMEQEDIEELHFTGHSLGGAIATLASSYFETTPHILTTFGSPRVGNQMFGTHVTKNRFQFINIGDPVPFLPPNIPGLQKENLFTHCGDLLLFDQNRNLSRVPAEKTSNLLGLLKNNAKHTAVNVARTTLTSLLKKEETKLINNFTRFD
jgi:triacylglycerol lipase